MLKCWRGNHEHRPTFTELKHSLDLLLESSLQHLPYFNVIAAPPGSSLLDVHMHYNLPPIRTCCCSCSSRRIIGY